uniref:non-specific serine/threonine protein kinase n=1 Tax=Globodera rostochiensis TaxID=31243 RepID=A0A914GRK1_GLORO
MVALDAKLVELLELDGVAKNFDASNVKRMGQWISVTPSLVDSEKGNGQIKSDQHLVTEVSSFNFRLLEMQNDENDDDHIRRTPDPNSFKLQPAELSRAPDEVFDVVSKIGEGSYGSVHRALHRESGHTLAVKMVPVDTDLQEIIKEITIMQQCDSRHVVKYYGSYFKDSDLWIVMEYCGAGSVSDIMRLNYLHGLKKIHRDIKAGNILLNMDGNAKLADFGVAGQITDTMAKRNTVIGTPFWMAPELIQEMGYDMKADIWSLGITAIEMAEGRPPHAEIHPMRAIFMIPTKPPPTLKILEEWTEPFQNIIAICLVKNPEDRATADLLLKHQFVQNAKGPKVVREMIANAQDIAAQYLLQEAHYSQSAREIDYSTLNSTGEGVEKGVEAVEERTFSLRTDAVNYDDGTLIQHGEQSLRALGAWEQGGPVDLHEMSGPPVAHPSGVNPAPPSYEQQQKSHLTARIDAVLTSDLELMKLNQKALNNFDGRQAAGEVGCWDQTASSTWDPGSYNNALNAAFRQAMNGQCDYSFLSGLSTEELLRRKELLEKEMETELNELQARYHAKRKAILDAIALKKNGTVQF